MSTFKSKKDLNLFYSHKAGDDIRSSYRCVVEARRLVRTVGKPSELTQAIDKLVREIEYVDYENGNYTTKSRSQFEKECKEISNRAEHTLNLIRRKVELLNSLNQTETGGKNGIEI